MLDEVGSPPIDIQPKQEDKLKRFNLPPFDASISELLAPDKPFDHTDVAGGPKAIEEMTQLVQAFKQARQQNPNAPLGELMTRVGVNVLKRAGWRMQANRHPTLRAETPAPIPQPPKLPNT